MTMIRYRRRMPWYQLRSPDMIGYYFWYYAKERWMPDGVGECIWVEVTR